MTLLIFNCRLQSQPRLRVLGKTFARLHSVSRFFVACGKGNLSLCMLVLLVSSLPKASLAQAQTEQASSSQSAESTPAPQSAPDTSPDVTVFVHPDYSRWWLSGQINIIAQAHPSFPAAYSGPNSMQPQAQVAASRVLTLYTGAELTPNTQVILDIESAGGHGLSDGVGIAGFPDLDVVRTPDLGQTPYLARFLIERTLPLGGGTIEADRDFLSLSHSIPARRLDLWAGKFSLVDFFDQNSVGSDSHLQFMNWAIDNNAAFDYAANTRGYTWGAMVEYDDRHWGARFGEAMMPKIANGENLDADLARAHSESYEVEFYPTLLHGHHTALRLLSYVNHADMGSYREAIHEFEQGLTATPDIVATRRQGQVKYGYGVNAEQEFAHGLRMFTRWGWNDGRTESFAYTEVDRTASAGGDISGANWRRSLDKFGAAFVVNEISGDHREYLALGGQGFMLGDGRLNYGLEQIFETYYTAHLWRGVFASADLQHVTNPGYNRDRGPILVGSLRLHVDF